MKKFAAGLIAGVSVVALTLITLLFDPDTFLQRRWKIISLSIAALAIVCMILQGIWTKQDEDEERKERERLYKLVRKAVKKLEERETRRGKGRITLAWQAASSADELLKDLAETDPTVKNLDPGSHHQLFEELRKASNIGQASFNEGGYYKPVPRERVLNEIERLVLLAMSESDEPAELSG
jgi:hypothetical protein